MASSVTKILSSVHSIQPIGGERIRHSQSL